ncbi:MAG TPA: ATP-dependent helicase [Desulfobulbaceae bacterium]|nr:ATP-dependent helicase [Desulfobulbaceae bacterium]
MQLTEEQQQIVHHGKGHARVSAVAGSGKTTAMVARVCRLLEQGVSPDLIRVLMFNRSAADAFIAKLYKALADTGMAPPEVYTFHALGLRLVRSFTRRGALPAYTLLTQAYEQERFAREAMKSSVEVHGGDESWLTRESMEAFRTFIDLVKSDIQPADSVFAGYELDPNLQYFIGAYEVFERLRRAAGVRFFNDLIHEPVLAIKNDPQLAAWIGNRVEHIIVDEYQDINEVQQQLLCSIAGSRAQVMVVGDVDQCIYEWRGARPEYIVSRFGRDFRGAVSYTLRYTFRYGHRLSLAANHLIKNNRMRDRKLCLSHETTPDTRLEYHQETEPSPLPAILADWRAQGRTLPEAVVLVRLFAAAVPVELTLLEANIPYRLVGHESVFFCREIQALLGYLYLCRGGLEKMTDRDEARALVMAMLTNPNLWQGEENNRKLAAVIAEDPQRAPTLIRDLGQQAKSTFLAGRLQDLAATWEGLLHRPLTDSAAPLLEHVIDETGLYAFYTRFSSSADAANKIRTCRAFVRFARQRRQNVGDFLASIEELRRVNNAGEDDCLLITSIHRAKGLEWPLVILPGLEDGVVPYRREEDEEGPEGIEDERRLMYVGMTRAIERLCLLYPTDRRFERKTRAGDARSPFSTEDAKYPASCFLYECNLWLSDQVGGRIAHPQPDEKPLRAKNIQVVRDYLAAVQAEVAIEEPGRRRTKARKKIRKKRDWLVERELRRGMRVSHKVLGPGRVKSIGHAQGIVTVEFPEYGLQNLVINLAKLRPVIGKDSG